MKAMKIREGIWRIRPFLCLLFLLLLSPSFSRTLLQYLLCLFLLGHRGASPEPLRINPAQDKRRDTFRNFEGNVQKTLC